MNSRMPYDRYETVIGLEIHVQLATESKAFCGDSTAFGGEPNTQVSPVSLGHPGTLPRLNARQVAAGLRLGLALGCRINPVSTFDRKNYFYADLPKGYQITQDQRPLCLGGAVPIRVGENRKAVRLHHIHLEEDAGKSLHDADPRDSLIDLNRAGVPLLEIVTEPDLRSAEEVDACMSAMRRLVRWLGVSDGNMEQGSMRCDVNLSVRPLGQAELGERCEIKNLNSMRYARQAIAYEAKRQIDLLEKGGRVVQQTLNFDPATGRTAPLREKEEAHDYRYFPEPDLPPVVLSEAEIEAARAALPLLPWAQYDRFREQCGLTDYDANLLAEERETALFFEELIRHTPNYKAAANLVINKVIPWCKAAGKALAAFPAGHDQLAGLIALVDEGQVSNTNAYQRLFPELAAQPGRPAAEIARALQLIQRSDSDFLDELTEAVLAEFPDKVKAYRKGKKGLLGFFMGEIMKRSRGKAEPKATNALLRRKLEN